MSVSVLRVEHRVNLWVDTSVSEEHIASVEALKMALFLMSFALHPLLSSFVTLFVSVIVGSCV
jgi:hypothetical protein